MTQVLGGWVSFFTLLSQFRRKCRQIFVNGLNLLLFVWSRILVLVGETYSSVIVIGLSLNSVVTVLPLLLGNLAVLRLDLNHSMNHSFDEPLDRFEVSVPVQTTSSRSQAVLSLKYPRGGSSGADSGLSLQYCSLKF